MNTLHPAVQIVLILCGTLIILGILGSMGGPKK